MRFSALLVSVLIATPALAHEGGITGYSGKSSSNCTDCHNGGTTPTVSFTGPSTLATGATGTYTFEVKGGAGSVGGLDIAVSGTSAKLAVVDAKTKLASKEITHTAAKSFSSGSVSWQFDVTAPSSAGSFTIYGYGVSANGDDSPDGDNAAGATLSVSVSSSSAIVDMAVAPADMKAAIVDMKGAVADMKGAIVDMKGAVVDMKGAITDLANNPDDLSSGNVTDAGVEETVDLKKPKADLATAPIETGSPDLATPVEVKGNPDFATERGCQMASGQVGFDAALVFAALLLFVFWRRQDRSL